MKLGEDSKSLDCFVKGLLDEEIPSPVLGTGYL